MFLTQFLCHRVPVSASRLLDENHERLVLLGGPGALVDRRVEQVLPHQLAGLGRNAAIELKRSARVQSWLLGSKIGSKFYKAVLGTYVSVRLDADHAVPPQ